MRRDGAVQLWAELGDGEREAKERKGEESKAERRCGDKRAPGSVQTATAGTNAGCDPRATAGLHQRCHPLGARIAAPPLHLHPRVPPLPQHRP